MTVAAVTEYTRAIADVVNVTAVFVAAGSWFFVTAKRKERVEFDIECEIHWLNRQVAVADVGLVFKNVGFVENKLYTLKLSVHDVAEIPPPTKLNGSVEFTKALLGCRRLLDGPEPYYVRPGVTQRITHVVLLNNPGPVIRITSGFSYHARSLDDAYDDHTARRLFAVPNRPEGR